MTDQRTPCRGKQRPRQAVRVTVPRVDPGRRRAFRRRLLVWYRRCRRDLPWRRTSDPYHILVSEIMLQQTQVDRVIPKYREFLTRYPSLEDLARARVDEVREAWYPLGYNVRPYRLHAIARQAIRRHGGRIPDDPAVLLRMKGIGRYTAGAILSFAYRKDAPVVDTNVRRVLRRVFLGVRRSATESTFWTMAAELLPRGGAYDYNPALMDFGATVCTARRPACPACPLRRQCASFPALSVISNGSGSSGRGSRGAVRAPPGP
ncbi:MAG: A/G-specific adenine glycosylase [Armatimonadetes bacterium]|nr:A/G-specific adenine glycosylase [Armatimonadota bacterium]